MVEFFPQAESDDFIVGLLTFTAPSALGNIHINNLTLLPEYVIAGGFALSVVTDLSIGYRDVDIWVTGGAEVVRPRNAHHYFESEWANSYRFMGIELQVMKTRHSYPIDVIKAFDMSICQVALYDLEFIGAQNLDIDSFYVGSGYKDMWNATCIMSKDVYALHSKGTKKSKAFIPDLGRMYKYARKLNAPIQELFDPKDIRIAVGADVTDTELASMLENLPEGVDYTLIERLRGGTALNPFT